MESRKITMEAAVIDSKPACGSSQMSNLLWKQIYNELKRRVEPSTFNSWFRNVQYAGISRNKIELSVSSKFIRDWLINNYHALILKIARCFKPEISDINIKVKSTRAKGMEEAEVVDLATAEPKVSSAMNNMSSRINKLFDFQKLVVDEFNRIAYQSARNLLNGDKTFSGQNVLYVHSKVGMGKTHLLQAIAHEAIENGMKAIYYSAERFASQYVYSCHNNQLNEFKAYNRSADFFIIDDIQFLCGKPATMQDLMATIISLVESDKVVIIACDSSPFQLNIDKRLLSRFTGGIVTEIQTPSYDSRLKILERKLESSQTVLSDSVLKYMAKNISNSIRELEGALYKVLNHRDMLSADIDVQSAKNILQENVNSHYKMITFERILDEAAKYFGVKIDDIKSKSRLKKFVYPRQIISLLAKQLTRDSLQDIGNKLGGRDHATVIYSITKLEEKMQSDEAIRSDISKLMKIICG